jgi:methanethiol oxidase
VKFDADEDGSLALDPNVFVEFGENERPHQVRLQGGDASSDSYCFPNCG